MAISISELTPVQEHHGILYKRDDLFMPFPDVPLSGGKVRQAMLLLAPRAQRIIADYGGQVLTASSVHSPQGLIIARVAHEYGLHTRLFLGATTAEMAARKHPMVAWAQRYSCELDCTAKLGYDTALQGAMRRHAGYLVRFGINLDEAPEAILQSTSAQAANVPASVRTVVIPTGSGITAAGIVDALPDTVERVIAVQISGHDRSAVIRRFARRPFDFVTDDRYPYSRTVHRWAGTAILLDPIYEAKAHDWMLRELQPPRDGTVLFWLIGNSTAVRSRP